MSVPRIHLAVVGGSVFGLVVPRRTYRLTVEVVRVIENGFSVRKKILTVFGTRPEAIKVAPLVQALASDNRFEAKVCVTAQHREMLDQVLGLFEIKPDYDLNIMRPGQNLNSIASDVLQGMKVVLADFKPDVILVHGDTSTTFATSLAAFYQQIKVGHVEAGLRTGNLYFPWPEEAQRAGSHLIDLYM